MLAGLKQTKGVYFVTKIQDEFALKYMSARKKEGRIYPDKSLALLPEIKKKHPFFKEWNMRKKSTNRVLNYLKTKEKPLKILDLGCGNGWFSNQLTQIKQSTIYAVDITAAELYQASRVFKKPNLHFVYADIFALEAEVLNGFDVITLNGCIQYFQDSEKLINQLNKKLNTNGEIHIIDSPFYKTSEIVEAKKRTETYYANLGFPEMANNYYHHSNAILKGSTVLYSPKKSIFKRIFSSKDTPFYWIKIN